MRSGMMMMVPPHLSDEMRAILLIRMVHGFFFAFFCIIKNLYYCIMKNAKLDFIINYFENNPGVNLKTVIN